MTDTFVATPDPEEPEGDSDLDALLEQLGPAFLSIAKAAVDKAVAEVPTPTFRPGEVQGVDSSTRTASVLVDGDTAPITAQVLTDLPGVYDRVMVTFVPPSAVFITGMISPSGVPAGTLAPFAGSISAHAGAAATGAAPGQPPRGWLWCAGQAVSRADYGALFSTISTTYGAGNGTTTFNVPDFRGRVPVGLDNMGGTDASRVSMANTLGGTGGSSTISQAMLPSVNFTVSGSVSISDPGHSHTQPGSTSIDAVTNSVAAAGAAVPPTAFSASPNTGSQTTGISASLSGATAASGGSGAEHLPPYALVHWLIKA